MPEPLAAIPRALRPRLACPACRGALSPDGSALACPGCGARYPVLPGGRPDLRPREPFGVSLDFTLGEARTPDTACVVTPFPANPRPAFDRAALPRPRHVTDELVSWLPRPAGPDDLLLDLACGKTEQRELIEALGFPYAGCDYSSDKAPILGDAQALPFADATFSCVLALSMVEHIRYPFLMAREVARVLKPGGLFLGIAAFLEPFHGQSYYHPSHLGLLNLLEYGGLMPLAVSPSADSTVLYAQSRMALFPWMPRVLSRALVAPLDALSGLWWRMNRRKRPRAVESTRTLITAADLIFLARKGR